MHSFVKIGILLFTCITMLTSCTSLSTQPAANAKTPESWENRVGALSNIQDWDLKGLIAIRNTRDAWSANWRWQQHQHDYVIDLAGPLGTSPTQLTGTPNTVTLTTADGKKFNSHSPESLLEKQLGWRLPVSNLYYWIRGLPVPNIAAQKQFDSSHRLTVLFQQGWRIEYLRYTEGKTDLPAKIILNNSALNVKIIINQWQL